MLPIPNAAQIAYFLTHENPTREAIKQDSSSSPQYIKHEPKYFRPPTLEELLQKNRR